MTVYEKGDVVLVPFPFSDQTTIKKRPAVIISSSAYNEISSDIIIMAVTSQTEKTIGIGGMFDTRLAGCGAIKTICY